MPKDGPVPKPPSVARSLAELSESVGQLTAMQDQMLDLIRQQQTSIEKAIDLVKWHQGAIDAEFEASPDPLPKPARFFDPRRPPSVDKADGPPTIPFRA